MKNDPFVHKFIRDLYRIEFEMIKNGKPFCVYVQTRDRRAVATYQAASTFRWLWLAKTYARIIERVLDRRCIVQENVALLAAKSS